MDRDQTYDEEERKRSEINKELQPRFQAAARSLIRKLFPRTKKDIIGNHDFNELRAQGRIGLHEFLATALCSSLSDHEFELSKAQDFVEKPEGREKLLKEVIEGKKYIVFCDLISAVCSRSLPRDRFEFCLSISRLLSSIENPQPHWNNQSENRIAWAVWKIIKFIFDSTDLGEKDILLKNLYETPSLVYIKGRIAHELFCTDTDRPSPWGHSLVVMSWTSSEILTRWRDEMQKLCKQVDFFLCFALGNSSGFTRQRIQKKQNWCSRAFSLVIRFMTLCGRG